MNPQFSSTKGRLTTPRAAAVAGILFSILMTISMIILWISVPPIDQVQSGLPPESLGSIKLALNLIPFAGIGFLWFIGVIRDQLGQSEDKFFATAFFGSGLLFLALWFVSAAVAGGIIGTSSATSSTIGSGLYAFGRTVTYTIMNEYAMKMAGVFMLTTCTLSLRSRILPRWMIFLGFGLALFLLFNLGIFVWAPIGFPMWILMISLAILSASLRRSQSQGSALSA
ncbi:MAG: hypothetical protein U0822_04710 [Anaerolineae bacterium]